jgi:hypothetical protein
MTPHLLIPEPIRNRFSNFFGDDPDFLYYRKDREKKGGSWFKTSSPLHYSYTLWRLKS